MFVIGYDELEDCPQLGNSVYCQKCKQWHEVEHEETLAFCKCNNKVYLVGLRGKMISRLFLAEEQNNV